MARHLASCSGLLGTRVSNRVHPCVPPVAFAHHYVTRGARHPTGDGLDFVREAIRLVAQGLIVAATSRTTARAAAGARVAVAELAR